MLGGLYTEEACHDMCVDHFTHWLKFLSVLLFHPVVVCYPQLVVILVVVVVVAIFCACLIIGGGAFVDRKRARGRELATAGGNGVPHTVGVGVGEDVTGAIHLEMDDGEGDERDGGMNGKEEFNSVHSPVSANETDAIEMTLAEPSQTSHANKEQHILSNLADTLDDGVEEDEEV